MCLQQILSSPHTQIRKDCLLPEWSCRVLWPFVKQGLLSAVVLWAPRILNRQLQSAAGAAMPGQGGSPPSARSVLMTNGASVFTDLEHSEHGNYALLECFPFPVPS